MSSPEVTKNSIAEIILLGTGGYGESVLIHRGEGKWIIVDSCINPQSKECLPLKYLKDRNIDIENDVEYIVCTHWHDDHIKGISDLFEEAKKAKFVISNNTDKKKFLQLVYLDYKKIKVSPSNSSTIEFGKCLDILKQRNDIPVYVSIDRLILKASLPNGIDSSIFSLSPSDYAMHNFNIEISSLITEFGSSNRKIIYPSINSKSVVLFLELGFHNALLGADLEVSSNNKEGWLNILDSSQVIKGKRASLIKISHHGSSNGYHDRIWNELLSESPVAKTTTYNKGQKLPTIEMIQEYCSKTDKFYLTSPHHSPKPKKRDKALESILKRLEVKLTEVKFEYGIVRCTIDMLDSNAQWEITTNGNAFLANLLTA